MYAMLTLQTEITNYEQTTRDLEQHDGEGERDSHKNAQGKEGIKREVGQDTTGGQDTDSKETRDNVTPDEEKPNYMSKIAAQELIRMVNSIKLKFYLAKKEELNEKWAKIPQEARTSLLRKHAIVSQLIKTADNKAQDNSKNGQKEPKQ